MTLGLPDFRNPVAAAKAWIKSEEGRVEAEKRLEAAKPQAEFCGCLVSADGVVRSSERTARVLPWKFIGALKQGDLFYQGRTGKNALAPKAAYREQGIFEVKAIKVDEKARCRTNVTPKGIQFFALKRRQKTATPL